MKAFIVGAVPNSFTAKDGNTISGYKVTLGVSYSDPANGMKCYDYFYSSAKCDKYGYIPHYRDTVEAEFNMYGKLECIKSYD